MLLVIAIILTSTSIICTPIFIWILSKRSEGDLLDLADGRGTAPIAIFGWLSTASFLFALILWVIYGITEYRTPIPTLNKSLSALETVLQETERGIARLKGQAVEATESVKNQEILSAKTASELGSLQSALASATRNQRELRTILTGPHWGERLWGFGIGFLSSLMVDVLGRLVCYYRKAKATPG